MWGSATDCITDVYSGDLTPEQAQERWVSNMTDAFKAAGHLGQEACASLALAPGEGRLPKRPQPGQAATMADMRSRLTRGRRFLTPGLVLMTLIVSV